MLNNEEVQNAYVEGVMHDCYYEGDAKLTPDGLLAAEEFREWRAAVEREVAAKAWDEGYTRGFYDREVLSGDSRDASEGRSENPYRKAVES